MYSVIFLALLILIGAGHDCIALEIKPHSRRPPQHVTDPGRVTLFCPAGETHVYIHFKTSSIDARVLAPYRTANSDQSMMYAKLPRADCEKAIQRVGNRFCWPHLFQKGSWTRFEVTFTERWNGFQAAPLAPEHQYASHENCWQALKWEREGKGSTVENRRSPPVHETELSMFFKHELTLANLRSPRERERSLQTLLHSIERVFQQSHTPNLLTLMKEVLREPEIRTYYFKRNEPPAQSLMASYSKTKSVDLLKTLVENHPWSDSGEKAMRLLAQYYFDHKNYTLAATYWDIIEDFGGNLSEAEQWNRIFSYTLLNRDPEKVLGQIRLQLPKGIHLNEVLVPVSRLSDHLPKRDEKTRKLLFDQGLQTKWSDDFLLSRKFGDHLKENVHSQRSEMELHVREGLDSKLTSLGKYLIALEDDGPILYETGTKAEFGSPLRFSQSEKIVKAVSGYVTCALSSSGKLNFLDSSNNSYFKNYRAIDICSTTEQFCSIEKSTGTVHCKASNPEYWSPSNPDIYAHYKHNEALQLDGGAKKLFCATKSKGACALSMKDTLHCWGTVPEIDISTQQILEREGLKELAIGHQPCALTKVGRVLCWEKELSWDLEKTLEAEGGVTRIQGSFNVFCAITARNRLHCWDSVNPQRENHIIPLQVHERIQELGGPVDILASTYRDGHVCVVTKSGIPVCWNGNYVQELEFDDGTARRRAADWNSRWERIWAQSK